MSANPDDHTLNLRVHRIMNDGFGTRLLLSDIGAIYMNTASGTDHFPQLDTSLQYADYAGWERSWLTSEAVTTHVECVRRAFRGVDAAFVLPTDHPRPAVRRCRGARIALELPRTVCAAAAAAATREQASLYTILL